MGSMSKENSFKLLDAFAEAGGNFIDTAVSLLSKIIFILFSSAVPAPGDQLRLTGRDIEQLSRRAIGEMDRRMDGSSQE